MPISLEKYVEHLDQRNVLWPKPPVAQVAKATPHVRIMPDIRAVLWGVYGTLMRIADGRLLHEHPQELRMQIALEKTIQEFAMANSMYRTSDVPWKNLLHLYTKACEDLGMLGNGHVRKGDFPAVNSVVLWRRMVDQLRQKGYSYDETTHGDLDDFCAKIAYFFHANLQGVEAAPHALTALETVREMGCVQGLLSDAQPFTLVQLMRALKDQGEVPPLGELFDVSCLTFSYQFGIRKPSLTLYKAAIKSFSRQGIEPDEILYIGCRLPGDLAIAKQLGMKTALYAADKISLEAKQADMKNPEIRPNRLLTDLASVRKLLEQKRAATAHDRWLTSSG